METDPYRRLATRYLFSALADMEAIGIYEAVATEGVEGQLEDEQNHQAAFTYVADMHGGKLPVVEELGSTIDWIAKGLDSATSVLAFTLLGETWINQVFTILAEGKVQEPLLKRVARDEARHLHYGGKRETAPGFEWVAQELERRLVQIALCPEFAIPCRYLLGDSGFRYLSLKLIEAHEKLFLEREWDHTYYWRDFKKLCRGLHFLSKNSPRKSIMSEAERDFQVMFDTSNTEWGSIEVKLPGTKLLAEARVVQAMAQAISEFPAVNRTQRAGRLWKPDGILIGVDRDWET